MEPKYRTLQDIADSNFIFNGRDIVSMSDFTREEIDHVLDVADWFKRTHKAERGREILEPILNGIAVASVFAEASTRTRCSFEAATKVLESKLLAINDPKASSFAKGEPLQDALRIMEGYVLQMGYGSAIAVMRHDKDGAARFAADVLKIPFINGGDGQCRHPTQAFLDLYSIRETQERIDGLKVAMIGDLLHGRTVHSLANALSKYEDVTLYFVAPEILQMPDNTIDMLEERGVKFEISDKIEDVIPLVDIGYMTRIQRERLTEKEKQLVKDVYRLNAAMLKCAKPTMRVLHPLPRYKYALEIAFDVDKTPHAYFFPQALNGLFTREGLFSLCTGRIGNPNFRPQPLSYAHLPGLVCPNERCITNPEFCEGAEPKFLVDNKGKAKCYYCETRVEVGK